MWYPYFWINPKHLVWLEVVTYSFLSLNGFVNALTYAYAFYDIRRLMRRRPLQPDHQIEENQGWSWSSAGTQSIDALGFVSFHVKFDNLDPGFDDVVLITSLTNEANQAAELAWSRERRILYSEELGSKVVTYQEMCSNMAREGVTMDEDASKRMWANLPVFVDTMTDAEEVRADAEVDAELRAQRIAQPNFQKITRKTKTGKKNGEKRNSVGEPRGFMSLWSEASLRNQVENESTLSAH